MNVLITGVTGQDGYYLARQCLDNSDTVFGLVRRTSRGVHLDKEIAEHPNFHLLKGDVTDAAAVHAAVSKAAHSLPLNIYNLAAQSFVPESWHSPLYTMSVNLGGLVNLLESVRRLTGGIEQKNLIRIYQASSSEMYGNQPAPQTEGSKMTPRSPYGVSKLAAHRMARVYRESYEMFVSCGICFNHEGPRRGQEFVTRKIARGVAEIAHGLRDKIVLGNTEAKRDWGYAGDYVRAMRMMLDHDEPDDFVIATNRLASVKTFLVRALREAGLDYEDPAKYIERDGSLFRPAEVHSLCGSYEKAYSVLGWSPSISLSGLVSMMVQAEMYDLSYGRR